MNILLVNAISTGNLLAPIFRELGHKCFHFRTMEDYGEDVEKTFFSKDFDKCFSIKGDNYYLELNEIKFDLVIPASEIDIEVAEKLAKELNCRFANDINSSMFRRNKFKSQERLKERGINSIPQSLVSSVEHLENWLGCNLFDKYVLKPINSSCSDGVLIFTDKLRGIEHFKKLHRKPNRLLKINDTLLIQKHVSGIQYFVNSVSFDGFHYTTDVWKQYRSRNQDGAYFFEAMTLCDPNEKEIKSIVEYNDTVLDCLDVKFGACHNEIIYDGSKPVLIECNPRLMGASISLDLFDKATGTNQVMALVESYVCFEKFMEKYKNGIYSKRFSVGEISFLYKKSGTLIKHISKDYIANLDSFFCFSGLQELGTIVEKTTDTFGRPGYVYLFSESEKKLKDDLNEILELQKNNKIFMIT